TWCASAASPSASISVTNCPPRPTSPSWRRPTWCAASSASCRAGPARSRTGGRREGRNRTPQPPSLRGKGETDNKSWGFLLPSPLRGGVGEGFFRSVRLLQGQHRLAEVGGGLEAL